MQRLAHIVELKADSVETYKNLHVHPWPEVLEKIKECGIQNYSIHLREFPDGKYYLFSYFEYVGSDFEADMARMAADPRTREWWDVCKPCLIPLPGITMEKCWAAAEEVFYLK